MAFQRFARRTVRRFGSDITGLVGGNLRGVTFGFGNNGTSTSGTAVTFDRNWWKNADKRDRRGALIHELTHVATRNQGLGGDAAGVPWADNQVEQGADAVRLALVGKHGINPDNLQNARRIAKREGWLDMANPNNGPRPGRDGHRRNTGMNAQSRVALGVLSPSQAQAFAAQGAGLQNAYATALAGIKAQGGQVRSDFQSAQADVKTQLISDVSGAEAAAQQAGVLGGSVDAANRTGAVLTAAATRQDNLATRNAALAQLRLQKLQASNDLYTGLAGLAGDRAAAEAELTAQRFQQDAYDAMQTNYHQLYQDILRRLLAKRGGGDGGNGDGGNGGQPGWADQLPPGAYVDPNNGDVYTGYGRNRRV